MIIFWVWSDKREGAHENLFKKKKIRGLEKLCLLFNWIQIFTDVVDH